jgi:glutathione peroxidase-family protein
MEEGIFRRADMSNLYDISVKTASFLNRELSEYKGKILLIVNTASDVDLPLNTTNWRIYIESISLRDLRYLLFHVISL